MNVKELAEKFGGFLGHYSGELRTIAATVGSVVSHLPIDQQDKSRLSEILDALQDNAGRIAAAASDIAGAPVETVTIDAADVEAAVRAVLPGVISTLYAQGVFTVPEGPRRLADDPANAGNVDATA